jgi:hypothetical protein
MNHHIALAQARANSTSEQRGYGHCADVESMAFEQQRHRSLISYLANLSKGKTVLWCYLMWYLVTVFLRFDPAPGLWLNSVGISAVIGIGLTLSVARQKDAPTDRWQTFRLFLMPFCVSSFAALIKGHDYLFIFPTKGSELLLSVMACAVFVAFVALAKRAARVRSAK